MTTSAIVGGMSDPKFLDIAAVAEHLDLAETTVRNYHQMAQRRRREGAPRPGDFPEPDLHFGRSPVWKVSTVNRWKAHRPGRGAGGGRPPKNREDQ